MESQVYWIILGRALTPYAVSVWLACFAAMAAFLWQGERLKKSALLLQLLFGTILGLLGARLYYVLARWELFADVGFENFFATSEEEYRLWGAVSGAGFWGAVGGVVLSSLLTGKLTGEKVSDLLDALAPAGALGIAISRFGEYSIGEGIGPEVESEALRFFPLAVMNEWEEWNYALFLLEGLAGLLIFILLVFQARKKTRSGDQARMFLILYSASQIVLEALRRDNFLRWLFVRVSQLTAALVLLGLSVFGLIRWLRSSRAGGKSAAPRLLLRILEDTVGLLAILLAVVGLYQLLIVHGEFELGGSIWWQLICESPVPTLLLLVLGAVLLAMRGKGKPLGEKQVAFQFSMLLLGAIVIVAMEFGIDKSATLSVAAGYLMETLCAGVMGLATWQLAMKN